MNRFAKRTLAAAYFTTLILTTHYSVNYLTTKPAQAGCAYCALSLKRNDPKLEKVGPYINTRLCRMKCAGNAGSPCEAHVLFQITYWDPFLELEVVEYQNAQDFDVPCDGQEHDMHDHIPGIHTFGIGLTPGAYYNASANVYWGNSEQHGASFLGEDDIYFQQPLNSF